MADFTGTQFHRNIGAQHRRSPTTIENALEAAKIGGVDITVISNPIHNLRDMDRAAAVRALRAAEPLQRRVPEQISRADRRHGVDRAVWRRRVPARVRARHQGGRAEGRLDHVEPAGQVSRRRRGDAVLPAGAGARRAGGHPSAVGRLRRGAHARLPAGVEHRPSDGRRARDRAADRARRVREIPEAQARRHPSRRRHLRDDRPHELCLPAAGRGVLPRLLRADADQARAAALPEDDVPGIDLLSSRPARAARSTPSASTISCSAPTRRRCSCSRRRAST